MNPPASAAAPVAQPLHTGQHLSGAPAWHAGRGRRRRILPGFFPAAGAGDAGAGRRTAAVAPAPPAARGIGIARPQAASRGRCAGAAGQWLWCQPGHGGAQAPADRRGDQGAAGRLRRLPRAAADRHPCQPPADR
ncbi:hypothetical protein G6F24_015770 [Rhizopus arrhizus]|nr:hypothetical protein G6F24_015770 [Rhizopus arrhizus]